MRFKEILKGYIPKDFYKTLLRLYEIFKITGWQMDKTVKIKSLNNSMSIFMLRNPSKIFTIFRQFLAKNRILISRKGYPVNILRL